jgi:hypothetical protein
MKPPYKPGDTILIRGIVVSVLESGRITFRRNSAGISVTSTMDPSEVVSPGSIETLCDVIARYEKAARDAIAERDEAKRVCNSWIAKYNDLLDGCRAVEKERDAAVSRAVNAEKRLQDLQEIHPDVEPHVCLSLNCPHQQQFFPSSTFFSFRPGANYIMFRHPSPAPKWIVTFGPQVDEVTPFDSAIDAIVSDNWQFNTKASP